MNARTPVGRIPGHTSGNANSRSGKPTDGGNWAGGGNPARAPRCFSAELSPAGEQREEVRPAPDIPPPPVDVASDIEGMVGIGGHVLLEQGDRLVEVAHLGPHHRLITR